MDYFEFMHPIASDEDALRNYKASLDVGRWSPASYPPPPYYYPEGIGTPREMSNLTARLVERGYKLEDVRKIMGENWLRVFRTVWAE
jgi:membrane dipeptidase